FSGRDEQYFADAETDCRRAWRLDNSLWEVYVALGRLYGISGQYDDAIDELRTAISQQPSAVEAYVALGDIYSAMNRNEEAESMFLSALSLDGGNWDVYNHYGHFFYDNHRYEEAIAQYQRVVDFTPDSGIGWDNLGNAYWAIGEFERAAEIFRRSLEIRPSRWAYSSLGSMQYYLGQFEESVENQRLAIAEAPEDHISWGRLAEAYSFIPGAEDEARSAWRRAIELARSDLQINPDDWDTHGQLALYHAFIGEYDVALQQLERVAELAPNEPQGRYYAALVHWQRGDADATYDALEAAIDLGYSSVFIVSDPTLADLRDEPRFAEFFR
ncbi:MAG TPA: tetratricopeptide repeat protein, partial [Gammaproteobacteria bacterium]|nr:tetratricopeptide repeat protein [Gammaproteobacteria bacterium]